VDRLADANDEAVIDKAQREGGNRMRLYYIPGASSLFPHIVLVEAELPFNAVKVDEHTKAMDDGGDYLSVNPLGYVPALQLEDGTVLTETVAIAQYICDRASEKNLAPANGTLGRAKLQSWLNFIAAELHVGCVCPLFDRDIPVEVKAIFHRRLSSRLAYVEQCLAGNGYLLGSDFSIADVYLFVVSNWARSVNLDLRPYPGILALRKRIGLRPAVQEAMKTENLIS